MLPYPAPTTRGEKMRLVAQIKDRLLQLHGDAILAIGLYGSLAQGIDGPYSDIELRVITKDGISLPGHEFIYPPFKIEIGMKQNTKRCVPLRPLTIPGPLRQAHMLICKRYTIRTGCSMRFAHCQCKFPTKEFGT